MFKPQLHHVLANISHSPCLSLGSLMYKIETVCPANRVFEIIKLEYIPVCVYSHILDMYVYV